MEHDTKAARRRATPTTRTAESTDRRRPAAAPPPNERESVIPPSGVRPGNTGEDHRASSSTVHASAAPPPPEPDWWDGLAQAYRVKAAARDDLNARIAAQRVAEAPAWRPSKDGVETLRTLIARAACASEDGHPAGFQDGAFLALAEDLAVLYAATHCEDGEEGYLSYDEVRTAIWRLLRRAEATRELGRLFEEADRRAVAS